MRQRYLFIFAILLFPLLSGCAADQSAAAPPATTASLDSSAATDAVSLANTRNPKKGVTLAHPNCEDIDALRASWYFDNQAQPPCPSASAPYIPRVYNAQQANDPASLSTIIDTASTSGWLLGFAEPNLPWHGNVSPEEGAKAWRAIEEAALPLGIKLVAPAPSQHNPGTKILPEYDPDPYGYTWLWAMIESYRSLYGEKPHFDALAWNFYDRDPNTTKAFLSARHQEAVALGYNLPIWVTEYAGRCWDTDKYPTGNDQIMSELTPWFNSTPWIGRYAWFANRIRGDEAWGPNHQSCSLINPDTGQPTPLGQSYRDF